MAVLSGSGRRLSVFVVVVAFVVVNCGTYKPPTTEALLETLPGTSEVEAAGIALVPYGPADVFLNHPTLLPEGWELCRQMDRTHIGDRFCDSADEDVWVQVAVEDGGSLQMDEGDPIEGTQGAVWLPSDERRQAAFPSGPRDVFVVMSSSLTDDEIVAIAKSIPLMTGREFVDQDPEAPLDLEAVTNDDLYVLLDSLDEEVRVNRRDGQISVFTSVVILRLFPVDEPYMSQTALGVPRPRYIAADRPLVVGESHAQGRSYAVWEQNGFGWRLEGQISVEEATELALEIIELVAALRTA